MKTSVLKLASIAAFLAGAAPVWAAQEQFTVMFGEDRVGHLIADTQGATTRITYDYKNNGRGPTQTETVTVDSSGLPSQWQVDGTTTFGSKIEESFLQSGRVAFWTDATGKGEATILQPRLYISQSASPWALGLYARVASKAGGKAATLQGANLDVEEKGRFDLKGDAGQLNVTAHVVGGIDLDKQTVFLDADKQMVAYATPEFIVIRKGYEAEGARLRGLVETWDTQRLSDYQKELAHKPAGALRIDNVRIFDPAKLGLTPASSVLVRDGRIVAVQKAGRRSKRETVIDGKGGTLMAGLTDMHAHLGQGDALLNLMAGITTVRDMGNDNAVLGKLVERMDAGELAGPRVVRSAFIEGKSATNAANGTVVESEEQAVAAVTQAAKDGFHQIKIYSSINPVWVPAMVAEAKKHGLRVAGHIPAFTTTDDMLRAGYDEVTHSNQLMLNWVLQPGDDTRTLLRVTGQKRFEHLDLNAAKPQATFDLMAQTKAAHDPTMIIMETLMLGRRGAFPPGAQSWGPHMPIGLQRNLKQPMLAIETPEDVQAFKVAFEKTRETLRILNAKGTMLLPGTDMGGHFWLHRELELFTTVGMTNAEVLKRATYDTMVYMKRDADYGSVKPGKVADLILIAGDPVADISAIRNTQMVVKGGRVYFPTEAYEKLGIRPFTMKPTVSGAGFVKK